jgi:hypothetical protein
VRPASTTAAGPATFPVGPTAATSVPLTGGGVSNGTGATGVTSRGQVFALSGISPKLASCPAQGAACVPFPDAAAGDIKAVGVTTNAGDLLPPDEVGGDWTVDNVTSFAVSAWGPWATPASFTEFDVNIDVDHDGKVDFILYNTRVTGSDLFVAELDAVNQTTGALTYVDSEPLNGMHSSGRYGFGGVDTAVFDSDTLVMPVFSGLLGLSSPRFSYWVTSGTVETGLLDTLASPSNPLTVDVTRPSIRGTEVGDTTGDLTYADLPGRTVQVVKDGAAYRADRPLGEMFVHFSNVDGARAQLTTIQQAQTIAVPTSLRVTHDQARGAFTIGATATSGLPVTAVSLTPAVCRVSAGRLLPLSAGRCAIRLEQSGNSEYAPAAPVVPSFRVQGATRTALSSSDRSSTRTQHVTLTARVVEASASPLTPTGVVRFYDGARLLRALPLDRDGRAKLVVTGMARGTHRLRVVYAGSIDYSVSTSPVIIQVVR